MNFVVATLVPRDWCVSRRLTDIIAIYFSCSVHRFYLKRFAQSGRFFLPGGDDGGLRAELLSVNLGCSNCSLAGFPSYGILPRTGIGSVDSRDAVLGRDDAVLLHFENAFGARYLQLRTEKQRSG